jgi:hypothetical protein
MKSERPGWRAGAGSGGDDRQDVEPDIAQPAQPDNQPCLCAAPAAEGSAVDDEMERVRAEVDDIHAELERKVDDLTVAATMVGAALVAVMVAAALRVMWALT